MEQALGEMARSGSAHTESNAEIHSLVQTKGVADSIIKPKMYNTNLIAHINETVGKIVDRSVDEYQLQDMKGRWRDIEESCRWRAVDTALAVPYNNSIDNTVLHWDTWGAPS